MRLAAAFALLAGLASAAAPTEASVTERKPPRSTDQPRPRDGDVAIAEELAAARRARTTAAYDLFIGRHPDHALTAAARRERAALAKPGR